MFNATRYPAATAYATVGLETAVASAAPHRLIQLLLEGTLLAIAQARQAIDAGDIAEKGRAISKAIQIIDEGLKTSLDDHGGELSVQLHGLYDYMSRRLLFASLRNNTEALYEVSSLLGEIKGAWVAIAPENGEV
jgi:flagellar protein FliS